VPPNRLDLPLALAIFGPKKYSATDHAMPEVPGRERADAECW
jgi:hypothetical protein